MPELIRAVLVCIGAAVYMVDIDMKVGHKSRQQVTLKCVAHVLMRDANILMSLIF